MDCIPIVRMSTTKIMATATQMSIRLPSPPPPPLPPSPPSLPLFLTLGTEIGIILGSGGEEVSSVRDTSGTVFGSGGEEVSSVRDTSGTVFGSGGEEVGVGFDIVAMEIGISVDCIPSLATVLRLKSIIGAPTLTADKARVGDPQGKSLELRSGIAYCVWNPPSGTLVLL